MWILLQVTKGKQATKGSKQIVEENMATLKFYRNMACGSTAFNFIINCFLFEPFAGLQMVCTFIKKNINRWQFQLSRATIILFALTRVVRRLVLQSLFRLLNMSVCYGRLIK